MSMLAQNFESDLLSKFKALGTKSESKFHYQPLDPLKNEIRLLYVCWAPVGSTPKWKKRLSPGYKAKHDLSSSWREELQDFSRQSYDSRQDVHCWVENVCLDLAPEYTALSYAWGSLENPRRIVLNGINTWIRSNLESALRALRRRCFDSGENYFIVWSDAICINQEDDEEKSFQVNMMRTIFSRAKMTFAWLGEVPDSRGDESLAMRNLRQIGEDAQARGIRRWNQSNSYEPFGEADLEHVAKQTMKALKLRTDSTTQSAPPSRILQAIASLAKMAWWQRVWVVQEVAISRQVIVACGGTNLSMAWDTLDAALTVFKHILDQSSRSSTLDDVRLSSDNYQLLLDITSSTSPFCEARRRFRKVEMHPTLRDILCLTCTVGRNDIIPMKATDQRDKIFALLGLANDAQDLRIKPNYGMKYSRLCTQVALALLHQGSIDILSYCRYRPRPKRFSATDDPILPSWVPDWAQGIPEILQIDTIKFATSAGARITHPIIHYNSRALTLELNGCFVDEIESTFPSMPIGKSPSCEEIRSWIKAVLDEFEDQSYVGRDLYGSSSRRSKVVWKTTIADHGIQKDGTIKRNSTQNYHSYRVLMQQDTSLNKFEPDTYGGYRNRYESESSLYRHAFLNIMHDRRLFMTKTGRLVLGPQELQLGDLLCIFLGAATPYAIREASKGGFHLVGEVYVHGIMDGEFMKTEPGIRTISLS